MRRNLLNLQPGWVGERQQPGFDYLPKVLVGSFRDLPRTLELVNAVNDVLTVNMYCGWLLEPWEEFEYGT